MKEAKKKILVVDDSRTAILVESMILKHGYELVMAEDGQDAVTKATLESPDLILMDVVMPRKTGFEACRELKESQATKNIPIILVTTRGEEENVARGFESGCNAYVTKPINPLELLSKIRDHIGG